jgi:hypothetical protein
MTTRSSDLAKIVAGTFIADNQERARGNPVHAWIQKELREGSLQGVVESFSKAQPEFLEPSLVLVEAVTAGEIECVIPCRQYDHESTGTFLTEVRFYVDPTTGHARRLSV